MARSTYIYVVDRPDGGFPGAVAVFTVKHEMITWLKRNHEGEEWEVLRYSDNPRNRFECSSMGSAKELLAKCGG